MKKLIQEIKISQNNSYKFYTLTPKQYEKYNLDNYTNLKQAFIFNVEDQEYIVIYTTKSYIHFWNHTANEQQPDSDTVQHDDLNLFSHAEPLKIAATLFSIMQKLISKGSKMFVIQVPNGRRDKIYTKIITSNVGDWFPGFEAVELMTGLIIYQPSPFKESVPYANSNFNKLVQKILAENRI